MEEFLPFFLIIFTGVFLSLVVRRLHIPWVVGLVIGGILMGPHVFDFLQITPAVSLISQLGLVFLMFMAGLETNVSSFTGFRGKLFGLAFINGAVPLAVGLAVAFLFGYGLLSALLVGIIFVSSSVAVVIPSLEKHNLLATRLGQSVIMTTVLQDIASLVMLSVVLQRLAPVAKLPLLAFYALLALSLLLLRLLLPRIITFFGALRRGDRDLFQQEFRSTFFVLLGTVIIFELLGLHPIIAGFFAGLVLSGSITSQILKEKIRTISYGIFIPTFFVVIGAQTDISVVLNDFAYTIPLLSAVILSSVLAKLLSGWLGARLVGFTSDQALLFGVSSIPQLSTTLAVAFSALSLGYIDDQLITAMVALSIVSVMVSTILMNVLGERIQRSA